MSEQHLLKYDLEDELKAPFMSIVLYDTLLHRGLLEGFVYNTFAKECDYGEQRWLLCGAGTSEADQVLKSLKQVNIRCPEIAKKIYDESRLSKHVLYSDVASDLIVAVKSMFVLSSSKANPHRILSERIDKLLRGWSEEFKRREFATDDICRKAVYASIFGPEILRKNDDSIFTSILKTKGGRKIMDEVNRYIETAKGQSSKQILLKRTSLRFKNRRDWKDLHNVA